jgi:copper chaperone CopZ
MQPQPKAITHLTISGMTSVHATRAVFTALAGVVGVTRADVRRGIASVEHDGSVTLDQLRDAVALVDLVVTTATEERRVLPVL